MRTRKFRYFVGDFETTVYDNQEYTEVWAFGIVEMYTENAKVLHSIDEGFNYLRELKGNICIYFHNLKFDGSFWIPYLEQELRYKQALQRIKLSDGNYTYAWKEEKYMFNNEYKYCISDRGMWYNIIIKTNDKIIEIRDSLKLLPFTVAQIGESFKTKHRKLEMEYTGFRYAGCFITDEEMEYIKNDIYVVKEALETMFNEGHKGLTIGSCCLSEFKRMYDKQDYENMFINLYEIELNKSTYGSQNIGEYIRKSYKGGWCYLVPEKAGKLKTNGITLDVNSLYPSMMHSVSGNKYPIGKPMMWSGNYIPDKALGDNKYFFIRIKTRFYIKEGYLPFIQLKNSFLYKGNICLTTSDVYDSDIGEYYDKIYMPDGSIKDTRVELTLTMTDYYLMLEHYELVDFEILDGCYFYSVKGIFDQYIDKYMKIKMNSTGAIRSQAKLFLNNLYGKLATSTDSSFKVAYVKEDGVIGFYPVKENNKKPGYIPCGSAITSYSRNFTIQHAQLNYYGEHESGFIYADTDSIHIDKDLEEIIGCKIDSKELCSWKHESRWSEGIFTRQKTYIEHVTHEGEKEVEPYYDVRCAGMPKRSKDEFIEQVLNGEKELTDFKVGLKVGGKLTPKRIKGGIVLKEGTYEMR